MDPWKIGTAAFATTTVVLGLALAWTSMSPSGTEGTSLERDVADTREAPGPGRDDATQERTDPERALRLDGLRQPVAETTGEAPVWVTDPSRPLPPEIVERARGQLREEAMERREEFRDEMREEIDAFLEEEGIDDETVARVNGLLDDFGSRMDTLREQVRSGEVDRFDAREEFRSNREAMRESLDAALGPDVAARLRERLPMGGRGGGPRIGGRGGGR